MSSNNRSKKLLKSILKANSSCGCGKPKLADVFEPKPKPSQLQLQLRTLAVDNSSSSNDVVSVRTDPSETTTSSTNTDADVSPWSMKTEKINDKCFAVVKESNDPFGDFKKSMKQMIVEKQIYEKKGLEDLLACFLQLNDVSHRDVIVRAFSEIWNDVVSHRLLKKLDTDR